MICKISRILNICIFTIYVQIFIASTGSYLNASLAPLSLTFDEMSNGCFLHIRILFRLRESYTFTNINWIIKRAINLNPTCVDKIMVMEACLHLSTSYLQRNLKRDFGNLASREVKSGQRWPSTRLHTIHITYRFQSDLDIQPRYVDVQICRCPLLADISSVCLSPPPPLTHHLQLLTSPPPMLNIFT